MVEIKNKKAYFDYQIEETFEAGVVLSGTEIKSVRKGSVDLKDTYARIKTDEVEIINMYIAKYDEGNIFNHDERCSRKLLLHKKEIKKIKQLIEREGYSLIPLKLYFKKNYVKILLGVGRGKKLYDKRESIKKRDLERESKIRYN